MDELLENFNSFGGVANEESKTTFEGLYKNWGRLGGQQDRRRQILETQRSERHNNLDKCRGILELVSAVEENINWNSNDHHRVRYRPNIYVAGFSKVSSTYRDVLMMSEWMVEKPDDFHSSWYVVPCPKATRFLLVANKGTTKFYTKYGQYKFECRTGLPGGNPCDGKAINQCCVLDCFYVEKTNTLYILDLLAWNNQPMTDCETEFRQFWLETKLAEMSSLKTVSKKNHKIITLLPKVLCQEDTFKNFMEIFPPFENNFPTLDGLLFYHKHAHYVSGETPLVGWLYPYMVPEILGADIKIHNLYALGKPVDYVNQAEFIQKFEEKYAKRPEPYRNRRRSASINYTEMEHQSETESTEQVTTESAEAPAMDSEVTSTSIEENTSSFSEGPNQDSKSSIDADVIETK